MEASLLREVAHPDIVTLIDVRASTPGKENDPPDVPTLVFPPADGDLSSFLDKMPRGQGLPDALARRLMAQLANAVAHVHAKGILHRDIKPENCLIFFAARIQGELLGPALRLADFGMARRVVTPARSSVPVGELVPRRPADVMMTPLVCTCWYRPPELWGQTTDRHDVDVDRDVCTTTTYSYSLDVWSYGAVVYEALTGSRLAGRAPQREDDAEVCGGGHRILPDARSWHTGLRTTSAVEEPGERRGVGPQQTAARVWSAVGLGAEVPQMGPVDAGGDVHLDRVCVVRGGSRRSRSGAPASDTARSL